MTEATPVAFDRGQHRRNADSADTLRNQGRYDQAAKILQQNLAMSSKFFGQHDLTVLSDRDSLSDCLRELGEYREAIKLDEVTLPIRQRIDPSGEDTVGTLQSLADNLSQVGIHETAIPLYRSALATRIKTLGMEHEYTLETKHNLASSFYESGRYEEASKLNAQILKIREKKLAADDDDLIATRHNLATNHYALGNLEWAAQLTYQNILALRATRRLEDPQILAISRLQERIKSTIQEAKRARAIQERRIQSAARQELGPVSDDQIEKTKHAFKGKASKDTSKRKREATKQQVNEVNDLVEDDVSKVILASSLQKDNNDSDKQPREAKPVTAGAWDPKHHQKQRWESPIPQSGVKSDAQRDIAKARAEPGSRNTRKQAMNITTDGNPSMSPGAKKANHSKQGVRSEARKVKFDVATPKIGSEIGGDPGKRPTRHFDPKPEARLTKHKSDSILETRANEEKTLKPDKKVAFAKDTGTDIGSHQIGGDGFPTSRIVPTSISNDLEGRGKTTGNAQQPQDRNIPHLGRSSSDSQCNVGRVENVRTAPGNIDGRSMLESLHIAAAGRIDKKANAAPLLGNADEKVNSRSSDEKTARRLNPRTLDTPKVDRPRSKSVGSFSGQQNAIQSQQSTFSGICDACDGEFYNKTASSRPLWFDRFQQTQSLVAQSRKLKGSRVKVAILDTGIDLRHPHFDSSPQASGIADPQQYGPRRKRIKECRSFVSESAGDWDSVGHGTHCVALFLDLSPNADVFVARVYGEEGKNGIDPEVVAKAIRHAADEWRVSIISMSFGWPKHQAVVAAAIDYANARSILICAAVGCGGANDGVAFPANSSPVICVNSTNEWGKPSNFTPKPEPFKHNFATLGENVVAAWPGRIDGRSQSGTSTATPILAAVMALVLEFVDQNPRKTADEKRLRDYRVMPKVLLKMSDEVEGYHYVKPWTMMSSDDERGTVETRIQDAIKS